ncbi:non-ribosomal peptide synthetase [Streptomyces sp. MBT33]|uniref:amino acid adenylation domain-containing protein n=1 Tax=Streptomyces sp. MBT33 TaxID=1488363 RepID=UPI001909A949|nr:non-ribosomal peptide synthetase [Streptomyces sp. MBT33]MBK3643113.1 amino acid adenylation domain-containing protein [Streptomyces sp. MBT33]
MTTSPTMEREGERDGTHVGATSEAGTDAPLSAAQQRVWFLEQLRPELVEYNMAQVLELSGPLDVEALGAALTLVVERHSVLRSRVVQDAAGKPRLRAEPASVIGIDRTDLRYLAVGPAYEEAYRLSEADVRRRFDLSAAPWLRARLCELPEQRYLFTLVVHHIAVDAASMQILWTELSQAYGAFAAGLRPDLPELPIQYADYTNWAAQQLDSPHMTRELAHWKRTLAGADPTELRTDRPRPAVRGGQGARVSHVIDPAVVGGVRELARRHHVTPFMVLFAAFAAVVSRHSGSRDVTVGVPMSGRMRQETEGLIGFFVNTVLLRTDLDGDPTFAELLSRVRGTTLDAYEHQEVPFDLLVDELRPERDLSRNPLFQLMFNLVEEQTSRLDLPGVSVRSLPVEADTARFDLDVTVVTQGERMEVLLSYATEIFEAETVARFAEHYRQVLAQVVRQPDVRLADLDVLTPAEKRLLRSGWNGTARPQSPRLVHELIDEHAVRRPDAIALTGPDGDEVSYGELARRSSALAGVLRAAGAGQDAPVGVLVERSPDMLVALLAVIKSGAAYLPLEPTYPRERLAYLLEDSGARLLLGRPELVDSLGLGADVRVVDLGMRLEDCPAQPVTVLPDDLAYVIYTSGSTGRPKGVLVPHRGLVNFVQDIGRTLELSGDDVLCTVTTISFDASVLELFVPLSVGARLVVVDRETASDGAALAGVLESSAATVLAATPATWHLLLLSGWSGGELQAVSGGEALSPQLARELAPKVSRLWNLYGPTETTVYSTLYQVPAEGVADVVPVGRPIANTQVYVVDDGMRLVPIGAVGELLIGGAGLTRGYAGRPGLTAERFVPDPFGSGQRLYRTGDLARRRHDGTLEYIGREDTQVKIRGHRIELGEIEAVLQRHPAVARAAVTTAGDGLARRIIGYVSWRGEPDDVGLRGFLHDRLPQYMVPAELIGLDRMPLTPNGKVDRKQLPAPERAASSEPVAPRDSLELRVTSICERVLGRSPVGVRDDFFAAGGNSLTAFELVEAVRRELGVSVPLSTFFRTPTVEGLCAALPKVSGVSEQLLVPLATAPRHIGAPLFLVHPHGGGVSSYMSLARELEGRVTVHGVEAVGYNTDAAPLRTVEEIAERYLDEISRSGADDPLLLAGWSFGGVVAYEMAVQRERAGRPVGALVLLDSPVPGSADLVGDEDVLSRIGADAGLAADEMSSLDDNQIIAALVRQSHRVGRLPDRIESTAVRRMVEVARANGTAAGRYRPGAAISADVYLLTVSEPHPTLKSPDVDPVAWQALTRGRVHQVPVPGNHHDMVHPPHVGELAERITEIVRAAHDGPAGPSAPPHPHPRIRTTEEA